MGISLLKPKTAVEKQSVISAAFQWESAVDPMDFLRAFPNESKIFFSSPNSVLAFVGVGNAITIKASGLGRFEAIKLGIDSLNFEVVQPGDLPDGMALPRLIGGFSFAPDFKGDGDWAGFEAATFVLPRYLLALTGDETWLILNRSIPPGNNGNVSSAQLDAEFRQVEQRVVSTLHRPGENRGEKAVEIQRETSQKDWIDAVHAIKQDIADGTLEKAILARTKHLHFSTDIDLLNSLQELIDQNPTSTQFLFSFSPKSAFLGATPEHLAVVDNGALRTMALAGSIGRGGTAQEDQELGRRLMQSDKNQSEHKLVSDYLEEKLTPLTKRLEFSKEPYLHKLPNVQHLRTDVEGALQRGLGILDVVEALHPTPALGGVPREPALELIRKLESESRGWYGAPVGWLDENGNGEFVVGIRSGVINGNSAAIYAGAGIVADSDPMQEWDETGLKFDPMLKALTGSME